MFAKREQENHQPTLHDSYTALDNDGRLVEAAKDAWRKIAPDEFTGSMESIVDIESENANRVRAGVERLAELKPDKNQDRVAKLLVKTSISGDLGVRECTHKVLPMWATKDTAAALIDYLSA